MRIIMLVVAACLVLIAAPVGARLVGIRVGDIGHENFAVGIVHRGGPC